MNQKWSDEATQFGLLSRMLVNEAGRMVISEAFLEILYKTGQKWETGEIDGWDNIMCAATVEFIETEFKFSRIPITHDEAAKVLSAISPRIFNDVMNTAMHANVLKQEGGRLSLDDEMGKALYDFVTEYAAREINQPEDVEPFIKARIVCQVKERMALFIVGKISYCYLISMLVFGIWAENVEKLKVFVSETCPGCIKSRKSIKLKLVYSR